MLHHDLYLVWPSTSGADLFDTALHKRPRVLEIQRRRTEGRTSESHGNERMEGMAKAKASMEIRQWWDVGKANMKQVIQDYRMLKKQSERAEEKRLENDLEELNRIAEPDQHTLRKIHSMESTLQDAHLQKKEGARIRARVKHAIEGERNTAFFFRQEKQHARAKTVSQVRTKDGSIQSSEEKPVLECMAKFYEPLFKSEQPLTQHQSEWLKSLATPARPEELSNLEGGLSILRWIAQGADQHAGRKILRK